MPPAEVLSTPLLTIAPPIGISKNILISVHKINASPNAETTDAATHKASTSILLSPSLVFRFFSIIFITKTLKSSQKKIKRRPECFIPVFNYKVAN